jgi:hypothetical protein
MGNRRQAIEAALAGWREAERKLAGAKGDTEAIQADIERHRSKFHQLSGEHMAERIDALKDAEQRRLTALPSTHPFHQAAQDEKLIANEIWENARESDEDTPQTRDSNQKRVLA